MFAQKYLRLLRSQAIRDKAEVHEADTAGRQKSAFTEDS
jgi:hypothetical protein